jgi:hypothetical protein
MLNLFKLLCISCSIFILGCSQDKKYVSYVCPDAVESISCSKKCKKDESIKISLLLNKENSSVIEVLYDDGVQVSSESFKKCTIFDEKNWSCERSENDGIQIKKTSKMTNGIHSNTKVVWYEGRQIMASYVCGK